MATGDLRNNLERLRIELRALRYEGPFDVPALAAGEPTAFLPLLHHAFLGASPALAEWLGGRGYELLSKSDLRFVELIFRISRVEFGYRHSLTPAQVLTAGFAERKALFAVDMLRLCAAKAEQLAREAGTQFAPAASSAARARAAAVPKPSSLVVLKGDGTASPSVRAAGEPSLRPSPQPASAVAAAAAGAAADATPAGDLARLARAYGESSRAGERAELNPTAAPTAAHLLPAALVEQLLAEQLRAMEGRIGRALGELGARMSLLEARVRAVERGSAQHAPRRVSDASDDLRAFGASPTPPPRTSVIAVGRRGGDDVSPLPAAFQIEDRSGAARDAGRPRTASSLAHLDAARAPSAAPGAGRRLPAHIEQQLESLAARAHGTARDADAPPVRLYDPQGKASARDYLAHLERRFEATEALVHDTLGSRRPGGVTSATPSEADELPPRGAHAWRWD